VVHEKSIMPFVGLFIKSD